MKRVLLMLCALCVLAPAVAQAQDARQAVQKAEADRAAAIEAARASEEAILSDRTALAAEVEKLEAQERQLDGELAAVKARVASADARRESLDEKWSRMDLQYKEISGNVRLAARDLSGLLEASPMTALRPDRLKLVQNVLREDYFPDIGDISGMAAALFDEMEMSSQVGLRQGTFTGRDGSEQTGDILTVGGFTTMYRVDGEVGFLSYSPGNQKFFALSELPPSGMARIMSGYFKGRGESVVLDMSGGMALQQVTQRVGLWEHLRLGGPVVIPIIILAILAALIIVQRAWVLSRIHGNTDKVMLEISALASAGAWDRCEALVNEQKHSRMPVIRVVADGLAARHEDRETLESVLQEAILREVPRVERGLSTIAIIGAVEPLLGLLGTVTGMIQTFRVITLYGTGDPRLMSAGISEALITTELGLMAAIPLMLLWTYLSRRSNAIIGDMEEKAVHLSNIIHRQELEGRHDSTPGAVGDEAILRASARLAGGSVS